jgi:SAM-dependent methyltransferase
VQNGAMADYNAAEHWSEVAAKAGGRDTGGRLVAGDDAPYYRYKRRLFVEKFLSRIPIENEAVLEVGCGPGGNLAEMLPRRPRRLVGCDVAPAMVDAARREQGANGAEVSLIDGTSLPFADEEFDISLTVTVLMHNPEDRKDQLIHEMCRVTKSRIYIVEDTFPDVPGAEVPPDTVSPTGSPTSTTGESGGKPGSYGSHFPRSVRQYAESCAGEGFELVDTQYLETFVSHYLFGLLNNRLDKRRTAEGEQFSRLHWWIETSLQPITRQLDRVIRRPAGELTLMAFDRRKSPASG